MLDEFVILIFYFMGKLYGQAMHYFSDELVKSYLILSRTTLYHFIFKDFLILSQYALYYIRSYNINYH